MPEWLKPYRKLLVALGTAAAIAAYPVYQASVGDGTLGWDDLRNIGLAVVGAVLLYFVPNKQTPVPAPLSSRPSYRAPEL